ncbi:MAG: hypothetical protein KatS3mg009_2198 [Acidimicrobiia bacterium]|nr:MAG: hypothetical protein KatS3mg009_2198 [Acidimicrobiia bacterium]
MSALSSETSTAPLPGSCPTPVGSAENAGYVVPSGVAVPVGSTRQRFTSWYPAPVTSSTSESLTMNAPAPGSHVMPDASGMGGTNSDVSIVWTRTDGCGVSAAAAIGSSASSVTAPSESATNRLVSPGSSVASALGATARAAGSVIPAASRS